MSRSLVLFLALALSACGGPSQSAAADAFATATNAYRGAVNAASTSAGANPDATHLEAFYSAIAAASQTYLTALRAIDYPDSVKDDAAALEKLVVVAEQRAMSGTGTTDPTVLSFRFQPLYEAMQDVAAQIAVTGDALGLSLKQ